MAITLDGTNGITTPGPSVVEANTSDPALRITQLGTGNALLVEDSANPDATPFVITSGGDVVVGGTTAIGSYQYFTPQLLVMGGSSGGQKGGQYTVVFSNNNVGPSIELGKSRSATVGTVGTIVQSGDELGIISFNGDDGTDLRTPGATIRAQVDGTPGTDDMPGRLVFSTTADGASTPTERARITSGGYFKASNNGTYDQSTGTFHEFRNTADNVGVYVTSTNASLANAMIQEVANRSASDQYQFLRCFSNSGTDTEILLRGDGNGYADGTWNNNGADYAEFFESASGQALTLGATVVLDGNKVREATDQDSATSIIGVVRPKEPSKASMVVGNTAWNKWANKYLTDDFDRYIMEDHDVVEWTDEEGKEHSYESQAIPAGITVPVDATRKTHDDKGNKFQHYKLNPAWNPDSEYVNRENRPEWNIIGLLGQVKILKGQPVGDRWIKMRDVSETVEEWMIR